MKSLQWLGTLCTVAALVAGAGSSIGCTDAGPLDDDQPRTPSTHYRELRGDDPPLTVQDSLGNEKPNLRGRLLQQ